MGNNHRLVAVTAVLGVLSTAAACGGKTATPATTSSTSSTSIATPATPPVSPTRPARTSKWIDLRAGDCLAEPPPTDPAVVSVTIVDCAAPHLAEAYLRAEVPVNAAVSDTANSQCETGFAQYIGGTVAESPYSIAYLIDSEQDRTSNNPYPSTVICLLQSADGQDLTGSARR